MAIYDSLCIEYRVYRLQTPNAIAHVEAYHSLLEGECLVRHEFRTFAEAYAAVVAYVDYYNHHRLHGALGFRTPEEIHIASMRKPKETVAVKQ